jgi:hypothetical protein
MKYNGKVVAALAACMVAGAVDAAVISQGMYTLGNHPDGAAQPPRYGMRLDELYNATGNHDIYTFDFDHPQSHMELWYIGNTIRIWGVAWGGRDVGSTYAVEPSTGLYTIDFTYNVGVAQVPGDDDLWCTAPSNSNFGFIQGPVGPAITLSDERLGFGYTFRLGNEDNDLGHRGFNGISGWGWMNHPAGAPHIASSDWLFKIVPAPGSAALLGLGVLTLARRRR